MTTSKKMRKITTKNYSLSKNRGREVNPLTVEKV